MQPNERVTGNYSMVFNFAEVLQEAVFWAL
jgi:hypothetical protein